MLFSLYRVSVLRMIRIEMMLGCYDAHRFGDVDGLGPLLPPSLLVVRRPASVRLFEVVYVIILGLTLAAAILELRLLP
jgi:hypothetical protein